MKDSEESKQLVKSVQRLVSRYRKQIEIDEVAVIVIRTLTHLLCVEFAQDKTATKVIKIALDQGIQLYRTPQGGM